MKKMDAEGLPILPAGITVSVARPEDRGDVCAIREVYEGLDYLDFMYPHYMSNPHVYCYILRLDKKPVGFVIRFVVDDGETVISGAGRTHESVQGQGLMKHLQDYADYHVQKQLAKPAYRKVYTTFAGGRAFVNRPNSGHAIMMQRHLQSYKSTKSDITRLTSTASFLNAQTCYVQPLWRPGKDEFLTLMMDPNTNKTLFSGNQLIVFWEPYRPIENNFRYIYDTSTAFVSGTLEQCHAVSFITQVWCKNGLRVDFDFFGANTEAMLQHMYNCLEYIGNGNYQDNLCVELVLYFPLYVETARIAQCASSWGLVPGSWSHNTHSVLVQSNSPAFPAKL